MNHTFRLTLLSLAVCLPLSAAPDKTPQLIKGWGEVTDPDGDCRIIEDKGEVTITVPKAWHDLTYNDEYTKLNTPRVLQPVEGDFTLQVKVRAFPLPGDAASSGGRHSFVSTGLLVWQDEKNFIRLERAAVGSGAPFIWVQGFTDGKSAFRQLKPLADTDTSLRVVRKGNRFTFLYDEGGQGKDWTEAHAEEVELPAKLRAGVVAINTTVREFPARLTGLELEPARTRQLVSRMTCGTTLSGLGRAMLLYCYDHEDKFPTASNWCDLLIENAAVPREEKGRRGSSFSPAIPSVIFQLKGMGESVCRYAMNKDAANLGISAPLGVVLLFETHSGWNQVGGSDILTTDNHQGDGCNVLFTDFHVEFVRASQIPELRWK